MAEDIPTPEFFSQPLAVNGRLFTRELTSDDLHEILLGLKDFTAAIVEWERCEEQRRLAGQALPPNAAGSSLPTTTSGALHSDAAPAAGQGSSSEATPASEPSAETQTLATLSETVTRHCLVVAGYLGGGYGRGEEESTETAVAAACAKHFGVGVTSTEDDTYPVSPRLETIHVIVDSGGGSLDSAFKTAIFLRRFAQEVLVYVPCKAKSAATLIAIGADRIVMSPYAELGPLDTQIKDPRNPTTYISALDCYRSVDYVREFGVYTISRALKGILGETQGMVPLSEVIRTATDFANGSVRPMLEQVKALDFGAWGRTLKIGETYARALRLRLRHPDSEEVADRIARKLVYGYTHHPYPIDSTEADQLGLTVQMMPKDVYLAAQRIAAACKNEARFVGFSEDVRQALLDIEELQGGSSGGRRLSATRGVANGGPRANVVAEPDRRTRQAEQTRPEGESWTPPLQDL